MPTKYFGDLDDALDYIADIVDAGLYDVQELRYWRSDCRFCVECIPLGTYWALPQKSQPIASQGDDDESEVQSESEPKSARAVEIIRGKPPKQRQAKRKQNSQNDREIGFRNDDPILIDVVLSEQDYRRDQAMANVEADSSGCLNATVKLLLNGLDDVEWSRLAAAGRDRDVVTLSVRLVSGMDGRLARSQVRLQQIIAIRAVGQAQLPLE